MYPALIVISLGVGSIILFANAAWFWLPLWRREGSGTAHGLFLTNISLLLVVVFKMIQVITKLLEGGNCDYPFSMVSAILIMFVSVVQLALKKGYFNFRSK